MSGSTDPWRQWPKIRSRGDRSKKPEPASNSWQRCNGSKRKNQSEPRRKGYESWHSHASKWKNQSEPWRKGYESWHLQSPNTSQDQIVPSRDADHRTIATNTGENAQEKLGKELFPSDRIVAALYGNKVKTQDEQNPCIKAVSRISCCCHSATTASRAIQTDEPVSQESWVFGFTKGNPCETLYFRPKKEFRTVDVISMAILIGCPTDGDKLWSRTLILELPTDTPSVIEIDDPWSSSDDELPIGEYISVTMRDGHAVDRIKSIVNSCDEDPTTKKLCGEYVLTANSGNTLDGELEWFLTRVVEDSGEEVPPGLPDILPSMATRFVMGKPIVKVQEMETICNDIVLHTACVSNNTFCLLVHIGKTRTGWKKASVYGDTPFRALDHLEKMWVAEEAQRERTKKEAKKEATVADVEGPQDVEDATVAEKTEHIQTVCNQQSGVPLKADLKKRIRDEGGVSVTVSKARAIVHFGTLTWLAQVSVEEQSWYYCPACNHAPFNGPQQLADHFGRKNCKMKQTSQPASSAISKRDDRDDHGWQEFHQVKAITDFEQEAHGCQPELRFQWNTGNGINYSASANYWGVPPPPQTSGEQWPWHPGVWMQ